jgi:hypothetical protein
MSYYLIYNEENELIGYSTVKQFEGQIEVDELPEKLLLIEKNFEEIKEISRFLERTTKNVLQYLEEMAAGEATTLTEQEFKDLCLERKNARIKINA